MVRSALLISMTALALAACQPAAVETAAAPAHKTYDAKVFFDTTAVSMSDATPYAFSSDGANLLLANDKSGVYNAAALPIAGGVRVYGEGGVGAPSSCTSGASVKSLAGRISSPWLVLPAGRQPPGGAGRCACGAHPRLHRLHAQGLPDPGG